MPQKSFLSFEPIFSLFVQISFDIFYRAEWFYDFKISIDDGIYILLVIILHSVAVTVGKVHSIRV